jgi:methylenetetrahydrofolate reductase (NADPH)
MRITDLYQSGKPVISFEFFPPKSEKGYLSLFRTIAELRDLQPGFVSVTMGAGGSTRRKTVGLVTQIQRELRLTAMAHLPCVGFERAEVTDILKTLQQAGLENVLALGGDPPRGEEFVPPTDGFDHAIDLVSFIQERGYHCVGGACFPEVHPSAESAETDLKYLHAKVQAGTDFLVTQLFFDNQKYFDFVERARAIGVDVPIVPGIMPITSLANARRMLAMGGGAMPPELEAELNRIGDSAEAAAELGIRWATEQCRELLDKGAPGIHFYTLNRSPATRRIYESLSP